MKQSRKPKTPSIKQIMADNNIRGMQQIMSDSTIRDRIDHSNCLFNTLTDKDGTTYRWKAGEMPTEKDVVPRIDVPAEGTHTDDTIPYTKDELEVRKNHSFHTTTPWTDNEVTGY